MRIVCFFVCLCLYHKKVYSGAQVWSLDLILNHPFRHWIPQLLKITTEMSRRLYRGKISGTVLITDLKHQSFFPTTINVSIVFKVAGGTEADLTVKPKKTQLYVCRVNDHLGNYVFSDWVKVKVLDIDKSGMHSAIFLLIYPVSDSV